jgi:hypothetical protein
MAGFLSNWKGHKSMNLIKDLIERVNKLEGRHTAYSSSCSTDQILLDLNKRITMLEKPKLYKFDLGDSTDDCIGMVARIRATNKSAARARLQGLLEETFQIPIKNPLYMESIVVHFGIDNIDPSDAEVEDDD